MRKFVYKFLIILIGLFFLYQFTIGYTLNKIKQQLYSINVKEYSNFLKEKIRKEAKSAIKKDQILNREDAIVIKNLIEKINKEINRYN